MLSSKLLEFSHTKILVTDGESIRLTDLNPQDGLWSSEEKMPPFSARVSISSTRHGKSTHLCIQS